MTREQKIEKQIVTHSTRSMYCISLKVPQTVYSHKASERVLICYSSNSRHSHSLSIDLLSHTPHLTKLCMTVGSEYLPQFYLALKKNVELQQVRFRFSFSPFFHTRGFISPLEK
ncbi:uncharacterized protein YALI1_A16952g [Yarrowia lipolytica]|uniref:Uncharacterized protein n=1 Tax=Yarrowia lipolytica TaxID=4952 RepID=A0A1D8N537_YARLL|nr:hypothetical protein YALI1_A16952g [Yarrowia lipolytica]